MQNSKYVIKRTKKNSKFSQLKYQKIFAEDNPEQYFQSQDPYQESFNHKNRESESDSSDEFAFPIKDFDKIFNKNNEYNNSNQVSNSKHARS